MKKYSLYIMATLTVACIAVGLFCWLRPKDNGCITAVPQESQLVGRMNLLQLLGSETALDKYLGKFVIPNTLKETGIDFTEDTYFFAYHSYFGAVVPLNDEGDFLSYATQGKRSVEEQRGLKWSVVNNSMLLCCDGTKAMLIGPATSAQQELLRNEIAACMMRDELQNPTPLLENLNNEDAVSLATTLKFMPEQCLQALQGVVPHGLDLSGTLLTAALSLTDSTTEVNIKLHEDNKGAKLWLDELDKTLRPLANGSPNLLQNTAVFSLRIGADGTKALKLLRQNKALRTKLLAANMLFDLDMIVKSIYGDVSFIAIEPNLLSGEHLIEAQINNDSFMQNVPTWNEGLTKQTELQFFPAHNGCYKMAWQDNTYYFGTHSNMLFLTNTDRFTQMANIEPILDPIDYKGAKLYATLDVQKMIGEKIEMFPEINLPQRVTLQMNDVRNWRVVMENALR